jgi:hypothetical protein
MLIKTDFSINDTFYFPVQHTKGGEITVGTDKVAKIVIQPTFLTTDVCFVAYYYGEKFGLFPNNLMFVLPEDAIAYGKNPHNVIMTGCRVIERDRYEKN